MGFVRVFASLSTFHDIRHNNMTYVILIYLSPQLNNGEKPLDTSMRNRRKNSHTSNKSSNSKRTHKQTWPKTKSGSRNPWNIPIRSKQIHPTSQRIRNKNRQHRRNTTPSKQNDKPNCKRNIPKSRLPKVFLPNMHNHTQKKPHVPILPKNRPQNQNGRMWFLPNP